MASWSDEALVRIGVSGEVVTVRVHPRIEEVFPAYHNPIEFRRPGELNLQFRLQLPEE